MGTNPANWVPLSDNNLIQGKGIFNCSLVPANTKCTPNAGLAKFKFTTGKKHRLRFINAGAEATQKISIDNHVMTVIAVDFVPIKPITTNIITLGIGQRVDVIVNANGTASGAYWLRSTISSCSGTTQPYGLAAIYYPLANTNSVPKSTAWVDNTVPCSTDPLTNPVPFYPIAAVTPPTTVTVNIELTVNTTGHLVFEMNGSSFRGNYNNPIMLLSAAGNNSYPMDPEWNVYNMGTNNTFRFIINNLTPIAHPWHFHGHNMQIMAYGTGTWDGKTVTSLTNPPRRDVHQLDANGYLVFQTFDSNPGVWPAHCHIAWHVSAGLYFNVLERPDKIPGLKIPSTAYQTCRDWAAYTGNHIVEQIDSGL
jgi:FtsP/CotA-like multicopper oxidase with cupredoxin domain